MTSRKKRADRWRGWGKGLRRGICPNCGERGAHYAPPGFGSPGAYICKKKISDEDAENFAKWRERRL